MLGGNLGPLLYGDVSVILTSCLLEISELAEELSHQTSCLLALTAFAEDLSFFLSQSCEA